MSNQIEIKMIKYIYTLVLFAMINLVYAESNPNETLKSELVVEGKNQISQLSLKTPHTINNEPNNRWEDSLSISETSDSLSKITKIHLKRPLELDYKINRSVSRWEDCLITKNIDGFTKSILAHLNN